MIAILKGIDIRLTKFNRKMNAQQGVKRTVSRSLPLHCKNMCFVHITVYQYVIDLVQEL